MARRLPVELLVSLVRRSFRPAEYPASIEVLFLSSPDEALPQFYMDPKVFQSLHPDMPDLAVPAWAADAAEFVALHRAALESEQVSANLHRWIDLTFGAALSGPAGLAAKNIHLAPGSQQQGSSSSTAVKGKPREAAAAAAAAAAGSSTYTAAAPLGVASKPASAAAGLTAAAAAPGAVPVHKQTAAGHAAAATAAGRGWASELKELRLLLESPARAATAEQGPSAGKEWFWLLHNPRLDPTHLLPVLTPPPTAGSSSSSSGSSRPWRSVAGCWWEPGWSLGAVALHAWPAHRERMRALAVDPLERWLATAGRSGVREGGSAAASSVVRVWELADAETKVQHTRHWSGSSSSSSSVPVAAFKGTRDGIEGFVVYQDAAIVYGGANLGLAPLDSGGSSSSVPSQQQQQGWSAPAAAVTRNVRMTGIRGGSARGLGSGGKGSREGLGPKAASSGSAIVGLGLLPHSKLLVVGSEDGQLKICR
ncbi:hypothetical protein OEZ86_009755 [Tetradesmus obliquus]|uniref:BEACH domain-containing protein n=1 Tax=Tetradesmus obliquus TaxID=3088 RepID=A0ABY8UTC7_TETOB|nr:hypothetical protein OEZ85_001198 [Tetradesmus obliquus]WIA43250.1 hypothetical protein OEZ86_009755 [Tetradesmus obliquus]